MVRAIILVLDRDLGGIFNVAGDGLLPWSEVAAICAKRLVRCSRWGARLWLPSSPRLGVDPCPSS